ncbi:hypothetical protein CFHF_13105 [Caulobacter flavus]|uniref:Uncharacterized protein n=1 Tax=Caulobacter flavus TaxID=1679497 RepID=A0A2N5CTC0_9CAUL|nr:hypothetical protein C1707_25050 [Caulobacter flavus]PLR14897.1 hypothetical protein CFHF_13105 [Caulobacter flavus]
MAFEASACTEKNRSELLDLVRKGLATPEQVAELARSIGCQYPTNGKAVIGFTSDEETQLTGYVRAFATSPSADLRDAFADAVERDFDSTSIDVLALAENRAMGTTILTEEIQVLLFVREPASRGEIVSAPRATSANR